MYAHVSWRDYRELVIIVTAGRRNDIRAKSRSLHAYTYTCRGHNGASLIFKRPGVAIPVTNGVTRMNTRPPRSA